MRGVGQHWGDRASARPRIGVPLVLEASACASKSKFCNRRVTGDVLRGGERNLERERSDRLARRRPKAGEKALCRTAAQFDWLDVAIPSCQHAAAVPCRIKSLSTLAVLSPAAAATIKLALRAGTAIGESPNTSAA
jgi:hypothetical protein